MVQMDGLWGSRDVAPSTARTSHNSNDMEPAIAGAALAALPEIYCSRRLPRSRPSPPSLPGCHMVARLQRTRPLAAATTKPPPTPSRPLVLAPRHEILPRRLKYGLSQ